MSSVSKEGVLEPPEHIQPDTGCDHPVTPSPVCHQEQGYGFMLEHVVHWYLVEPNVSGRGK